MTLIPRISNSERTVWTDYRGGYRPGAVVAGTVFVPDASVGISDADVWRVKPGTSIIAGAEAELAVISKKYALRQPARVLAFLRSHPTLSVLALEALGQIRANLGDAGSLTLEVVEDPDSAEEQLVSIFSTRLKPKDVAIVLDKLDADWMFEARRRSSGLFGLDVEFLE